MQRPDLAMLLPGPGLAWLDLDWAWVAVLGPGGPELAGAWLGLGWASIGGPSGNLSGSIRRERIGWLGRLGWLGCFWLAWACSRYGKRKMIQIPLSPFHKTNTYL